MEDGEGRYSFLSEGQVLLWDDWEHRSSVVDLLSDSLKSSNPAEI